MRIIILLIAFIFCSCAHSYEAEEDAAIRDITNQYLDAHFSPYFKNAQRTLPDGTKAPKFNVDSLQIKTVFSDTLNAFKDLATKREFLFENNRYSARDQAILKQIVASPQFMDMEPRNMAIAAFDLVKPFSKATKSDLEPDEIYTKLKFSRVCFDDARKYALVLIDLQPGFQGNLFPKFPQKKIMPKLTLLKKVNGTWTIVE